MVAGFYDVNTKNLFDKRVAQAKANGYVWACDYPQADQSFEKHKSYYHGNSKLLLHLFYNDITGKNEMQSTTKTITKTYPQYKDMQFEIL